MEPKNNIGYQIQNLLQDAANVLIVIGKANDVDAVAAGLGLYLALEKSGRKVTVVSPYKALVELSYLFAINKIGSRIAGGSNLIVSLPYHEGDIETVTSKIDNDRLNLIIVPRNKNLNFDPGQIKYSQGTGTCDLIVTVAVSNLNDLGSLYTENSQLFQQKPLINIDNVNENTNFGQINLIGEVSLSQIIASLARSVNLVLDQDAASNLLTGVSHYNQGLNLTGLKPDVLETAAYLMRFNGQVLARSANQSPHSETVVATEPTVKTAPLNQTEPNSMPTAVPAQQDAPAKAPEDWLKPKIFTTKDYTANN